MGSVSSDQGAETRTAKSQPLALEVPVVATGARPGDQSEKRELFTEETETVLVFEHGAVIHLAAAVAVGQMIFLTNKQTGKEVVAQVLRKRSYRPTACYVELDFTEPALGFWGVEFPEVAERKAVNDTAASVATDLAEAELTEEAEGPAAPPPDQAEVARLRSEVEALKSKLKTMATATDHVAEMQQPSASELDTLKALLESKAHGKESEHVEEEKKPAANDAGETVQGALENKPAEETASYPIRMQLPKAGEISPRAAEFAADSAAITAAHADEHLLPTPSLDFERFPGVKESQPKLFSGKARRSLSGPIGVLVVIVLLLTATAIGAYRLGWLGGGDKTNVETEAKANLMPSDTSPSSALPSVTAAKENPDGTAVASGTERNERPVTESKTNNPESVQPERLASPSANGISTGSIKRSESYPSAVASGSNKGSAARVVPKDTPATAVPQDDVYVPPKLLKAIRSLSPPEALRAYASGVVLMDAVVGESGRVTSATPVSGPKALYKKAEDTVKEYVYQPATRNGKPVPAHVQVKIQFWYEP
jgi:hypothetical protein